MIKVKHGARIDRLAPEMWAALAVSGQVFSEHGYDLVVTSGQDGTHQRASAHYTGRAIDYRIRHVHGYPDLGYNAPAIQAIFSDLRAVLGKHYDVVLESNHFHVEFDPKEGVEESWYSQGLILEGVA